jgi:hypothetical protein
LDGRRFEAFREEDLMFVMTPLCDRCLRCVLMHGATFASRERIDA